MIESACNSVGACGRKSFLIFVGAAQALLLLATLASTQQPPPNLQARVEALLQELEKGTDAQRQRAEWELLGLGPEALPFLPAERQLLAPIVTTLKELLPRTWTPKAVNLPLGEALKDLHQVTGLELVDRRQGGNANQQITFELKALTFWEAADAIAAAVKARISHYQTDGRLALVEGAAGKLPVIRHGPFRVAVRRLSADLDFETESRTGKVVLELAWEPRFSPFLIETGMLEIDKQGGVATVPAGSPVKVSERNAREFEFIFAAPPRQTAFLKTVAGSFTLTLPARAQSFTFKKPAAGDRLSTAGISVAIAEIERKDWWTFQLSVQVPAAGPKFESFQTWLGSSEWLAQAACHLEKGAGENKQVLKPDPLRTRVPGRTATQVTVRYSFKPPPASAATQDWQLVCRIPGRMIEVRTPFSFANLPLP